MRVRSFFAILFSFTSIVMEGQINPSPKSDSLQNTYSYADYLFRRSIFHFEEIQSDEVNNEIGSQTLPSYSLQSKAIYYPPFPTNPYNYNGDGSDPPYEYSTDPYNPTGATGLGGALFFGGLNYLSNLKKYRKD